MIVSYCVQCGQPVFADPAGQNEVTDTVCPSCPAGEGKIRYAEYAFIKSIKVEVVD